jgi:glutamate-1-semialdehyde aminotransferase
MDTHITFMESEKMEKLSDSGNFRELIEAVTPRTTNDTRESWLRRAARMAGCSYRSTKAVFYSEITDPDHKTITKLRRAAQHHAVNLARQFELAATSLDHRDADFHSHHIAALLLAARDLRRLGVPEDEEMNNARDC